MLELRGREALFPRLAELAGVGVLGEDAQALALLGVL